jgi:hypothetical protein
LRTIEIAPYIDSEPDSKLWAAVHFRGGVRAPGN